jgi:uncharacterized protein
MGCGIFFGREGKPTMTALPVSSSVGCGSSVSLIGRLRRWGLRLLIAYLGVVGMLAWFQRTLMYHPRKGPVPISEAEDLAPHLRECHVTAHDGIKLHGWLSLSEADSDIGLTQPLSKLGTENRLLVVMFAGNAGNRLSRVSQLALYNGLGCDALLVDYRGYAENQGTPSEAAFLKDARTVWDYVVQDLGVPPERIVISGESLGGGVATGLACEVCREGHTPAALVLRATFSSMVDTAAHNYWWLPVRQVLIDRYPSSERMGSVDCPLLCYHGEEDRIVPHSQGRQLFEAAPSRSKSGIEKRFLSIPGAGHNDLYRVGSHEITRAIHQLLREVLSRTEGETR